MCRYYAEQIGTSGGCNAIPFEGKDVDPPECKTETEDTNLRTRNAMTRYWCIAASLDAMEKCETCVAGQIAARTGKFRDRPPFSIVK